MNTSCSWEETHGMAEKLACEADGVEHWVWDKPTEIEWAKKAWNALARKGLNTYESPCDKAYVQMQILTLAAMFFKYLEVRYGITVLPDYYDWFETLEIDLAHLENMVGKELTSKLEEVETLREIHYRCGEDAEDVYDQEATMVYQDVAQDKVVDAIQTVIRMQSPQVFDALISEFNGSSLLFISLLQTQMDNNCLEWIESGMLPECSKVREKYC